MSFSKVLALFCCQVFVLGSATCLVAQESKNPFASNIIGTLANKRMASELELLDEQQESINQLMKDFGQIQHEVGQDMKAQWEAANEEEKKEIGKLYWSCVEESRLEIVKAIKANLLPHQNRSA